VKSFNHVNAKTVGEAVKLLKNYEGEAKLIAGGTDLLGALKDRISPDYPELIINIKTIPNLDYIEEGAKGIKIGALAKLADIAESSIVKEKYKLLAEAAEAVATPQIRRMGTIGGNLCQDIRCWYYRYPHHVGGRIFCYLKGGRGCYALTRENQYHSIFGGSRLANPPCSSACPAHVDVPSYLSKVRDGDLREAAKILLSANPIPSITGRVCPRFCEKECNRGDFDESVSIRDVERFVGDYILKNANKIIEPPETESGKIVAVVGSGPAGLSAAYYLRMLGHRVTVFDRMKEPGGMLNYGIPAYRLPKDIVRRVVKMIEKMGIEFKTGVDIGKDLILEDLKKDFDGVFLAIGAWSQPSIGLEGEELTISGLEFLTNVKHGVKQAPGKRMVVIGGGNVAIDAARTALRIGCKEVTIIYRRSRQEMPANEEEVAESEHEGVNIHYLTAPIRILGKGGQVVGAECIRMELGKPDASGRRQPIPIKGSEFVINADMVIAAIGQVPNLTLLLKDSELKKSSRETLEVDTQSMATNLPGLFAGGDAVLGPATVIEAIAAGQRAAVTIDLYLSGARTQAEEKDKKIPNPFLRFNSEYLKTISRAKVPKLPLSERRINVEDALGLSRREVGTEANRCFNCGCVAVNSSDIAVALMALDAKIKIAGPRGFRTVSIEEFFNSLRNLLETDDIITEIQIPQPPGRAKQTFLKFRLRNAIDFPIVSVASIITIDSGVCKDARIALGAVAPRPVRATGAEQAIKGKVVNATTAEEASKAAVTGALPLNKNKYKVEIATTLVKRAILS
jgi:NADPH-dependent glutamate synthase beta subunit-like oxidoreductase/CO/xanthine dehydrogenase FAD-binding subunit